MVVAIALPRVRMLLIERRPQRAAFLELAVEDLGLPNAVVVAGRVEDVAGDVDVALARAFAPLDEAWARAAEDPSDRADGSSTSPAAGRRPPRPPAGSVIQSVLRTPVLESAGALVIMTRQ